MKVEYYYYLWFSPSMAIKEDERGIPRAYYRLKDSEEVVRVTAIGLYETEPPPGHWDGTCLGKMGEGSHYEYKWPDGTWHQTREWENENS